MLKQTILYFSRQRQAKVKCGEKLNTHYYIQLHIVENNIFGRAYVYYEMSEKPSSVFMSVAIVLLPKHHS